MWIGPGIVGFIVFLIVWLALGHFWIGVIAGILVALCSGGIVIGRRGRSDTIR